MPQTPQEWYARVRQRLDEEGYRHPDFESWTAWPWHGVLTPRELAAPVDEEPLRNGAGGQGCFVCDGVAALDPGYLVWHDQTWVLGIPDEPSSLPFALFLMPRRHTDLAGLDPAEAARQGELLALLERAACEVLAVPRIQVARWGDGAEHLHWWLYARPTGMLQLRGTFLSHWADLLPPQPDELARTETRAVIDRLVELAGGERIGG